MFNSGEQITKGKVYAIENKLQYFNEDFLVLEGSFPADVLSATFGCQFFIREILMVLLLICFLGTLSPSNCTVPVVFGLISQLLISSDQYGSIPNIMGFSSETDQHLGYICLKSTKEWKIMLKKMVWSEIWVMWKIQNTIKSN